MQRRGRSEPRPDEATHAVHKPGDVADRGENTVADVVRTKRRCCGLLSPVCVAITVFLACLPLLFVQYSIHQSQSCLPQLSESQQFRSSRGHLVGYAQYGSTTSHRAVIVIHGMPGSRVFPQMLDLAGYHVIAIERPGYGGSQFQPNRNVADFSRDIVDLADHLGVSEFSVVGFSGGGPYAYAASATIPSSRLLHTFVFGGMAPLDQVSPQDLPLANRLMLYHHPPALGASLGQLMFTQLIGDTFPEAALEGLPPPDRDFFKSDPGIGRLFVADARESFRCGAAGVAYDTNLFRSYARWGFSVEQCRGVALTIVHGRLDANVPSSHPKWYAERVPQANVTILPDHGHVSLIALVPRIFREALGE